VGSIAGERREPRRPHRKNWESTMPLSRAAALILAAVSVTASAALTAGTAIAAPAVHGKPVHAKPVHGKPAPKKPVKGAHFSAQGLIVSATPNSGTVTVLAHTLHDGSRVKRNQLLTAKLAGKHGRAQGLPAHTSVTAAAAGGMTIGDSITLAGTSTGVGTGESFTATTAVEHAAPAHVYLGTVLAVNGNILTVAKAAEASDDPTENSDGSDSFTVDISSATVTLDGATGALAPGQSVAVLGEGDSDTVLASSVFAFSTAPTVLGGEVSTVTGTAVTLTSDDTSSTVDLAGVPLYFNGNPSATPGQLTTDAHLLILGSTDAAGAFTPTLAFAFDNADTHPAGDNTDD